VIHRDLPYYEASISESFVAGMNQFARDLGIVIGHVPYEKVVATQFLQGSGVTGVPPHASTTGMEFRSAVASTHGANQKRFCPPGQGKKPGRGSAFNC
jgi:hypothetical protein